MSWFTTATHASAFEMGRRHPHLFATLHVLRRAWWLLLAVPVLTLGAFAAWWVINADVGLPAMPDVDPSASWAWIAAGVAALVVLGWAARRWGSDVWWWLRYTLPSRIRGL